MSRGAKALAVSLALGLGVSACSRDYTVAFLYVTAANSGTSGLIDAYSIDYQLGRLEPLSDSPISSGGANPVGLVLSTNTNYTTGGAQYLYVINNSSPTSTVVEFAIGTDGKLYPQNTYPVVQNAAVTVIGTNPTAIAMDPTDTFLYITFQYQNGYSVSSPGPGGVAVFPIHPDGSLGSPLLNTSYGGVTVANPLPYYPVGNNPVGIAVSSLYCTPTTGTITTKACTTGSGAAGQYTQPVVYVIDQDSVSGTPTGVILAFQQQYNWTGTTPGPTGYLTPVNGSLLNGYAAGSLPAGISVSPNGPYLYVTDETNNLVYGKTINANGSLTAISSTATGLDPLGLTIDPTGKFLYVANYASNSVSSYTINTGGTLTAVSSGSGASTTATGNGPNCVVIEPALGTYLYTSNNLGGTVSGMQLSSSTGALTLVQGTPYAASKLPTCAAAAPSGTRVTESAIP